MKTTGLQQVDDLLFKVTRQVPDTSARELRKAGNELAKLAKRMAPIDTGALESAIKVDPPPGAPQPRLNGRFAKIEVTVYVDGSVPSAGGKTVGDYAYEIHEHQEPVGSEYGLGPGSLGKQMGDPEVVVGGGFMDRAADRIETGIDAYLDEALREAGL